MLKIFANTEKKPLNYLFQIITLLFLSTFGTIILTLFSFLIFFFLEPSLINEIVVNGNTSVLLSNVSFLKLFQSMTSIGMFLLPSILYVLIFYSNFFKYLEINMAPRPKIILFSIIIMISAIPFVDFLGSINSMMKLPSFLSGVELWMKSMEQDNSKLIEKFMSVTTFGGLTANIVVMAVLPAICEEIIFRGIIQKLLIEITKRKHFSIIITAFLFSAIHLQFYGFLPRFVLGIFLGYLFCFSKSLWITMIAHFTNNFIAVLVGYLQNIKLITYNDNEIISSRYGYFIVIISVVVISLCFKVIYKDYKKQIE